MSEITIKDVYELVDQSRRETSQQFEKVNGDITDVKVQVGKIETKLDSHEARMNGQDDKIEANSDDLKTMRDRYMKQLQKAAGVGGVTGTLAAIIIVLIEFFSRR